MSKQSDNTYSEESKNINQIDPSNQFMSQTVHPRKRVVLPSDRLNQSLRVVPKYDANSPGNKYSDNDYNLMQNELTQ